MLEVCQHCGQPVAADAFVCPHCGRDEPLAAFELGPGDRVGFDERLTSSGSSGRLSSRRPVALSAAAGDWEAHYDAAMNDLAAEDYSAAIRGFSQALVEAPDESMGECYANRGYCYFALQQY